MDIWFEPAAKAATYATVLLVVGTCATRWLLLPRIRRMLSPDACVACERSLARTLLTSAVLLVLAVLLRAWTHSITVFGLSDGLSVDRVRVIVVDSRWGQGWRVQLGAALLMVLAALGVRAHQRAAWFFAVAGATALCGSLPFLGHAAGHPGQMLLHGLHVLAAGLWVGTLTVVAMIPSVDAVAVRPRLLRAFAPVAMTGAGILVASGATAAWIYLGSVADLWRTEYGRVLALKVMFVAATAVCGYLNWRQLRIRSDVQASRRYVAMEICLAVAVVLLTSWLSETAHPLE